MCIKMIPREIIQWSVLIETLCGQFFFFYNDLHFYYIGNILMLTVSHISTNCVLLLYYINKNHRKTFCFICISSLSYLIYFHSWFLLSNYALSLIYFFLSFVRISFSDANYALHQTKLSSLLFMLNVLSHLYC